MWLFLVVMLGKEARKVVEGDCRVRTGSLGRQGFPRFERGRWDCSTLGLSVVYVVLFKTFLVRGFPRFERDGRGDCSTLGLSGVYVVLFKTFLVKGCLVKHV